MTPCSWYMCAAYARNVLKRRTRPRVCAAPTHDGRAQAMAKQSGMRTSCIGCVAHARPPGHATFKQAAIGRAIGCMVGTGVGATRCTQNVSGWYMSPSCVRYSHVKYESSSWITCPMDGLSLSTSRTDARVGRQYFAYCRLDPIRFEVGWYAISYDCDKVSNGLCATDNTCTEFIYCTISDPGDERVGKGRLFAERDDAVRRRVNWPTRPLRQGACVQSRCLPPARPTGVVCH